MIVSNYNCVYFEDMLSKYVSVIAKPLIYIRSYGWNNTNDVEKINASMEIYKNLLPLDLYVTMTQSEFSFIEIDNIEEAIEFCEDSFPESSTACDPESYVQYMVYNDKGQVVANN